MEVRALGMSEGEVVRTLKDRLAQGGDGGDRVPGLIPPHSTAQGRSIPDLIVEFGYATREQVDEAIEESHRTSSLSPGQVLLENKTVSSDQLSRVLAERFGLEYVDLSEFKVNFAAANLISVETARRYKAVPVEFIDDRTILLAITDPGNVVAIDDLSILTGHRVKPAVASIDDLEVLVSQLSKLDDSIEAAISVEEEQPTEITDIRETAEDAPVIRLTHAIIAQALDVRASDIHLEPSDDEMHVRYRVDGILVESTTLPRRMVAGVVSRVKVMADLDIAEHRVPQDGRVSMKVDGRLVDIRVVTLPSTHGEKIVMRLLDKGQSIYSLDKLGLQNEALARFEAALSKPYGAIFVTGPTGSGKTTTLYAGLQILNQPEKNIITIEDPVEYQLPGLTQIQIHPKAGLTFSSGLRSVLRADPDIIMVGEIRDRETVRTTIESALTGHLVLTTLHTNNAPGAITRLAEMEVEPFLIASALDCIVAQRLARMLCSHCKRPAWYEADVLRASGFEMGEQEDGIQGYEAVGCRRCRLTGFNGRIGIFEVMSVSEEIRHLTLERVAVDQIRDQARREGMLTLREDGLEKIRQGLSSVEEVTRVIS